MRVNNCINFKDTCRIKQLETDDKTRLRELHQEDWDLFWEEVNRLLAKCEKARWTDVFWFSFGNCGAKISYDWLSSGKR